MYSSADEDQIDYTNQHMVHRELVFVDNHYFLYTCFGIHTWNGLASLDDCSELEKQLKQWSGVVFEAAIVNVDEAVKQPLRPAHLNDLK